MKTPLASRLFLCLCLLLYSAFSSAVDESKLLPADEAFQFSATLEGPDMLILQWQVAEGYYLYKKRIKLSVNQASSVKVTKAEFPVGLHLDDPAYGDVVVYRKQLQVRYPLQGYKKGQSPEELIVKYQGCADVGVCYPPIKKIINLNRLNDGDSFNTENGAIHTKEAIAPILSEQDSIAASLASDNLFLTIISFFGFGLLLAFTPCVFPMIPILSGIIIGQGQQLSTRKAFSLSFSYVLAMALTYTLVGVLAAVFGTNLQIWFQNPWVLSSFAAIFVLLALSMFGFYELQMPAAIQEKLNNFSNRQESGKLISAAIMGVLSALIVGPCVTAPLIGALIYIGQTGDTLLGGSALFALGFGMGAPLLVIGTSAGKILPNSGAWMETVKYCFGILMIAVAIWLLDRILPAVISQLLWAILIIVSGIYMGALRHHTCDTSNWQLLWKGLGFTLFLYGAIMVVGASTGKGNLLHPLAPFSAGSSQEILANTKGIEFKKIKGIAGLNNALEQARNNGQTVMLDFYADWCISCKEMEETTFTHNSVTTALGHTLALQADVTANDEQDIALLKHFGIVGPPAILFFNNEGQEKKPYRVVGFSPAETFSKHVTKALNQI